MATVTATAKVTKINQKTREVTLKTDDGQEYSFVAGDQVKNLAQVKKGDIVTAVYTQAIAYEINPGKSTGVEVSGAAAVAQPGTKPAGAAGQKITITVKVIALDAVEPSVTFKGPQGNTRKVRVSDPQELVGVKIGDTVDLIYTEAVAIKVEKASKN